MELRIQQYRFRVVDDLPVEKVNQAAQILSRCIVDKQSIEAAWDELDKANLTLRQEFDGHGSLAYAWRIEPRLDSITLGLADLHVRGIYYDFEGEPHSFFLDEVDYESSRKGRQPDAYGIFGHDDGVVRQVADVDYEGLDEAFNVLNRLLRRH
jgi:hypothetical protein